ncbi:RmlD substrate binding domain superfamily protein [Halogeometricum pallidum JCM 14848]|uniref:RmlD substrate binding domain superfamily protein n=1 Tax=Halogeometricum pallidum JCM 14848 TaxID=1227487 RepID=M0D958_HALPD|nr:RmlD substrate binding domain superfamily protein [Halogeometricum pallidum JCM 14848]
MARTCLDHSIDVAGTYHSTQPAFEFPLVQHDIRDTERFESMLREHEPDAVVNCAAMTDVDGCESQPEAAFEVNGDAPGALASICAEHSVPFVHVSTDYVFDGEAAEPYSEDATTNPIQEYGKSKLEGEHQVREVDGETMLVRLSFVYGVRGDTDELVGFPAWVRDTLDAGDEVPLFVDQRITPSRAGHAAEAILELLDAEAYNCYHVASRSCVTPHEFGQAIADVQGADNTLVRESKQADVSRDAARPQDTCLNVSKVEDALGRAEPTLSQDLERIEEMFAS